MWEETLKLKLDCLLLGKLLTHNQALYNATIRQCLPSTVLAMVASKQWWTHVQFSEWCQIECNLESTNKVWASVLIRQTLVQCSHESSLSLRDESHTY